MLLFWVRIWNSEDPIKEFRKCIKATEYAQ